MEEKSLRVLLTADQWRELNVERHKLFVRAAFYLGLPYTYINLKTKYDAQEEERNSVIESAFELGMREKDQVYLLKAKVKDDTQE